ncbi:MAG: SPOR domain-containing protein [candidate division WOR-3 bacterium]
MSKLSINRIIFSTTLIVSVFSAQNIDEAIKLFNAFQFDKAREIFKELVKDENNPRIAEVFYYLARLTANPDSSVHYYRTIVNKYPQSRYADIAYLEIAKIFIGKQDFKNAMLTLNQLNNDYPNSELKDEVLFWTGVVFIEIGNKENGYKVLQELINAYPKSIWANRAKNLIPSATPQREYYTIQIGSFRNKENAEKRLEELKTKGFDARIVEAVIMDKIHYRVWIGEFETLEEAKSLLAKLDSLGIKGNVVKGY